MCFAPFPSTHGGTFQLNSGKHLYPVMTGNKKVFRGVSHIEGMMKNSQKEPWSYTNTAIALGAPEQGKTWEWLQ